MKDMLEKILAGLQKILPQRWLTSLVHRLMHSEIHWLKNALITVISSVAGVDWSEAASTNLESYSSFNAFFTRELRPGARAADPDPAGLISPCDGCISQYGVLNRDRILQAKGNHYSLRALLANDPACAALGDGLFFTLYLSPKDYHRVHMPVDGSLLRMIHVPGRLFSVAPYAVRQVPGLFARNERVVSVFNTAYGPVAIVLVGAMLVASMETVWAGSVTPSDSRNVSILEYPPNEVTLGRGQEMGRFNMGSSVILLLPPGAAEVEPGLRPNDPVRLGQRLAKLHTRE